MITNGRAATTAGLFTLLIGCGGAADEAREPAAEPIALTEVTAKALGELSPGSKLSMDLREPEAVVSFDLTDGPIDFSRVELIFSNGPIRVPDWLKDFNVPREKLYRQDGFFISRTRRLGSMRWPVGCEVCAYHQPATWVCWNACWENSEPTLRDLTEPPPRNHEEELPPGPVRGPDTDPPPGGSSGGGSTGGGGTGGGGSSGGSSGSGGSSSGGGNSSGGLGGGGPSTPGPGL